MLRRKPFLIGIAVLGLLLVCAWILKPKTVRQSLADSGVQLVKRVRDDSDILGPRSPGEGIYSAPGASEDQLISALKQAGFRTEAVYGSSVALKTKTTWAKIKQFIRSKPRFSLGAPQRAWIKSEGGSLRLYFQPDIK